MFSVIVLIPTDFSVLRGNTLSNADLHNTVISENVHSQSGNFYLTEFGTVILLLLFVPTYLHMHVQNSYRDVIHIPYNSPVLSVHVSAFWYNIFANGVPPSQLTLGYFIIPQRNSHTHQLFSMLLPCSPGDD